jgi:signal transduction histidine kinase
MTYYKNRLIIMTKVASESRLDEKCTDIIISDEEYITEQSKRDAEIKLLHQQIAQMQKIESLGRLTAGIAHDFNNILSGIMGFNGVNALIIDDELPDGNIKDELLANIEEVDKASKRAARLIKQMMAYSRNCPADADPEIRPTVEVLAEALALIRPAIGTLYHIYADIDNNLDIQVDATHLHQIITNLIINARDSMKSGGEIKVSLDCVTINKQLCTACIKELTGNYIELSVKDTGTGIPKNVLDHIFDPFFTTKPLGEGTGLGLSTVSGIVHKAGGHIVVETSESLDHHGTTFRLLFPL